MSISLEINMIKNINAICIKLGFIILAYDNEEMHNSKCFLRLKMIKNTFVAYQIVNYSQFYVSFIYL